MSDIKLTKNLARCKPSEGFAQMVKIRKLAEKWIKEVGFAEIYRKAPEFKPFRPDMTDDEATALKAENARIKAEQGLSNFLEMFDKMFAEYPQDTLSLMALCCFVEPEDVDNYEMADFIEAVYEMATDKAVINFFTLCINSVQILSSAGAKR